LFPARDQSLVSQARIPVSECGELVQDEPSRNLGPPHAEALGAPAQFFDDI
jgi:hypothetical protein